MRRELRDVIHVRSLGAPPRRLFDERLPGPSGSGPTPRVHCAGHQSFSSPLPGCLVSCAVDEASDRLAAGVARVVVVAWRITPGTDANSLAIDLLACIAPLSTFATRFMRPTVSPIAAAHARPARNPSSTA